jgi:hypothetical protein
MGTVAKDRAEDRRQSGLCFTRNNFPSAVNTIISCLFVLSLTHHLSVSWQPRPIFSYHLHSFLNCKKVSYPHKSIKS